MSEISNIASVNSSWIDRAPSLPQEAIECFLGSGLMAGIGEKTAIAIVQRFGKEALTILDEQPERYLEIKGITPKKLSGVIKSWSAQKDQVNDLARLLSWGASLNLAQRIISQYPENTATIVGQNPYQLIDTLRGVGFKIADRIAIGAGISHCSPFRFKAALEYVLLEFEKHGHTQAPAREILKTALEFLDLDLKHLPSLKNTLRESIKNEQTFIVTNTGQPELNIALTQTHRCEKRIAARIHRLLKHPKRIKPGYAPATRGSSIKKLSPSQENALKTLLKAPIGILTGGPGVGKTTLTLELLNHFPASARILLASPTGRAAKRLSDATGREAKTIHRLLGSNGWRYVHHANNPLKADVVIIDEFSMVDTSLAAALFEAIPDGARVFIVGDQDQLPSVGCGSVLRDLIACRLIPTAPLTEVHRQKTDSPIIMNAHRINQGIMPENAHESRFFHIPSDDKSINDKVVDLYAKMAKHLNLDPRDIQLLTPAHKGSLGTIALNQSLQARFNPDPPRAIQHGIHRLGLGDKVIQTRNDYAKQVYNGDAGMIVAITGPAHRSTVKVLFDSGRTVEYDHNECKALELAWAMTVHKSQGSEYPGVIIPITTQHFTLLARNTIYTAITRAKEMAAFVGDIKAMHMALHRQDTAKRWTGLTQLLLEAAQPKS